LARAASEIKPANLLANGFVTSRVVDLPNATSVIGVNIRWSVKSATQTSFTTGDVNIADSTEKTYVAISGNPIASTVDPVAPKSAPAHLQRLVITRNYFDEKFFLRAELVDGVLSPRGVQDGTTVSGATPFVAANASKDYEFTVRANSTAAILARVLESNKNLFSITPAFLTRPADEAAIVASGTAYKPVTTLDNVNVRYEFGVVPAGYYVLSAIGTTQVGVTSGNISANPLSDSGVGYYVLVKESGTARIPSDFVVDLRTSGNILSTGALNDVIGTLADGTSGVTFLQGEPTVASTDVVYLVLNTVTGQVATNYQAAMTEATATARSTFEFEIVARLLLSTDTVASTYQIDNRSLKHKITLFDQ
jgi:hypothetical protein